MHDNVLKSIRQLNCSDTFREAGSECHFPDPPPPPAPATDPLIFGALVCKFGDEASLAPPVCGGFGTVVLIVGVGTFGASTWAAYDGVAKTADTVNALLNMKNSGIRVMIFLSL